MKERNIFARHCGNRYTPQKLGIYKIFLIFVIGCIVGVIIEMLWCILTLRTFESRTGLIYGPFNPVYGFGAVIITILLYRLSNKRDLWIFLCSALIGGAFEYICSLFQETVFGTISWDYPTILINLHGRTSILFCMFWGILGVLWIKDLLPLLLKLIDRIPHRAGIAAAWVIAVFLVFDAAISSAAVLRRTARIDGDAADNRVEAFLDKHYNDDYLQHIYPNMIIKSK